MAEKRPTRETKLEIVRQYYAGKSVRQIATEHDYSVSSIYRWIKEFSAAEPGELYTDNFTVNDLGWMYSMISIVAGDNRLVRETTPSSKYMS